MRNVNRVLLVMVLLLVDCATQQLTALQQAELAYVESSIAYEAAQNVVVQARSQHLVSDGAWKIFDDAQIAVQNEAPKVRQMLTAWRATGTKPAGFDAAISLLQGAASSVDQIKKGIH